MYDKKEIYTYVRLVKLQDFGLKHRVLFSEKVGSKHRSVKSLVIV